MIPREETFVRFFFLYCEIIFKGNGRIHLGHKKKLDC